MVSLKHIKSKRPLAMQRSNRSSFCGARFRFSFSGSLSSIKVPIYRIGRSPAESNFHRDVQLASEEEQCLLDSLLLARWEESSWKGLVKYDVTSCATKVVGNNGKFVVQLNESWCLNIGENGNILSLQLGTPECSDFEIAKEDILFCVTTKDADSSEFALSAAIPKDSIMVLLNETPVEYGHVFLLPYNRHHDINFLESLGSIIQVAAEINNNSLRIFYDSTSHAFFQACYFASTLAVEIMPVLPLYDGSNEEGISISEVANYPLNVLMFYSSTNIGMLIEVVSNICSNLNDQHVLFNLLISECGRKIFLFLLVNGRLVKSLLPQCFSLLTHWAVAIQVRPLTNDRSLCAWECAGHLLVNTFEDFKKVNEEDIISYLAAMSIDDKGFEAVKQLCYDAVHKLALG